MLDDRGWIVASHDTPRDLTARHLQAELLQTLVAHGPLTRAAWFDLTTGRTARKVEALRSLLDAGRLGTQANLDRLMEWFGPATSGWIGKTIVLYYSPDVRSPDGKMGGTRVKLPERQAPTTAPRNFTADASPGPLVTELPEEMKPRKPGTVAGDNEQAF